LLIWSLYFITRNTYRQKKLGEMKNDFINNMTHEFKTPVSTISLACEAMRDIDVEKTGVSMDNYLKIIDEENKRLGKLAEQILQTALVDKGQLYLSFEETDIHSLIQQVLEKYRPAIELTRGELRTKLFAENPILSGDKTHLYNMLSNLVDNAIKYSDTSPWIEILTTGNHEEVCISILDQGIGISKANQKRIFEKLYRVPTGDVHNAKGFGLGLSYVKYIVERHHGNVKVESELGKGSRFLVTLPRHSMRIQEQRK
jgi:two-component system phosphate regulon sensor histidine kinase PhoR